VNLAAVAELNLGAARHYCSGMAAAGRTARFAALGKISGDWAVAAS
jgi:hypothetical protein